VEEQAGIELFWQTLLTREYQAYLELAIAARTDADLRAIFEPKARRFDAVWRQSTIRLFPEWSDKQDKLMIAIDFCQAAMEGLLLNRSIWQPRERRVAVRKMVSEAILSLREG
jgi:hypothetical protein